MRIGHLITRLIIGGAQENTIFTCQGLIDKGHSVDLITGPPLGPEGSLIPDAKRRGINLILIPELRREINPFFDLAAFLKISSIFRKKRYDIIHTHSAKAGILGRIAAKITSPKSKVVHTLHGLSFHNYQNFFLNLFYIEAERFAGLFTDKFITVGDVIKEKSLAAKVGKKEDYITIHSGFSVEDYNFSNLPQWGNYRLKIREKLGIKKEDLVIGNIGRLFPLKGQHYLIEALPEIKREVPKIKLLLVGEGILHQKLADYAKEKGVEKEVIFTGLIHPEQIPQMVSVMDILVHTSLREGLPKAAAQALAGGKAVIAFDIDGAKEVVKNGETGYLIPTKGPPMDVQRLTSAVIELLKNREKREEMGKKGKELIFQLFPVQKMVDSIEKAYNNLVCS